MGADIAGVRQGSIAWEVGIRPGDKLLAINDHPLTDLLVYRFYEADSEVALDVRKQNGEELIIEIEKDQYEDLGLEFTRELFDGTRRCRNRCQFCFVDQMPANMRPTLYIKDDDFRLSFLYGNFVTLTNLADADWETIRALHLSPLYVSVHATDPEVRRELMTNPASGDIMINLRRLASWNIDFHSQIVLCPGINDGAILVRTLEDLSSLWPRAKSVAIVPVGLTQFREGLSALRSFTPREARELVGEISRWQQRFSKELGTRFVWLADEFYLLADLPLPEYETYESFWQLENGVGLSAIFLRDFEEAVEELPTPSPERRHISLATSKLGEKVLRRPLAKLREIENLTIDLHVIPNGFFGSEITVSGLITAGDLIDTLKGRRLGDALLIPGNCLRDGNTFLDDYVLEEVSAILQVPIIPVSGGRELVERVTQI